MPDTMPDTPKDEPLPEDYVLRVVEKAGLTGQPHVHRRYLTDVYLFTIVNHAAQLEADNDRLRKELDAECMERSDAEREARTLAHWKAEAMEVGAAWERVWEALGEPGALGASKAEASLAEVERLRYRPSSVDAVRHEHVLAAGDRLAAAARGPIVAASVDGWRELNDALAAWTALVEGK